MSAIEFSFEEPCESYTLVSTNIVIRSSNQIFDIKYIEGDETPQDAKNNKDTFELFLKSLKID